MKYQEMKDTLQLQTSALIEANRKNNNQADSIRRLRGYLEAIAKVVGHKQCGLNPHNFDGLEQLLQEREKDWRDLELLHRRQEAKLGVALQAHLCGNPVSWTKSGSAKTGLEEHIRRFQEKLGCAPSLVSTCAMGESGWSKKDAKEVKDGLSDEAIQRGDVERDS